MAVQHVLCVGRGGSVLFEWLGTVLGEAVAGVTRHESFVGDADPPFYGHQFCEGSWPEGNVRHNKAP